MSARIGRAVARRAAAALARQAARGAVRRATANGRWPWPAALAGVLVSARAAQLLLRPRSGLIDPDPVRSEELFDPGEVARARAYRRRQMLVGAASGAVQAGALVALVRRPAAPVRRPRGPRPGAARIAIADAGRGAALTLGLTVVALPFDAIEHRRARSVGLATQGWPAWAVDAAKSTGIGVTLSSAASAGALTLMRRAPRTWWLPAAGAAAAGGAGLMLLAPVVLDPAFNRFEPLEPGSLRDGVFDLAQRAGVRVREVYAVDASRRTTAANAYVTGLGPTKRVVLFDTLLERFTEEEARVVVAHELAHVRHHDVPRGLAYLALVAPAALQAASALTARVRPAGGDPDIATLAALALSLGIVGAPLGVGAGLLSRTVERRADVFSLRLTDAPEAFIAFERKIVSQNLADPDPPRWLVALGSSHPPALQRVGVARAYERMAREPVSPSDPSPAEAGRTPAGS